MTFPFDIHIGQLFIPIHFVTDVVSIYVGYAYYKYLRLKQGDFISTDKRLSIILGAGVGALIGSRLLAFIEHIQSASEFSIMSILSNKTIAGGVIGGILGVEITKKILKIKTATGDLLTFPLMLGIAVGRVGCFLTGVKDGTTGNVSSLPWAFDQGDGLARHPTALYEIVFLVALFSILKNINKKNTSKPGVVFRLFAASYLLFRFIVEFIKPVDRFAFGLSAIQLASLLFALYYLWSLVFVFRYRPFSGKGI